MKTPKEKALQHLYKDDINWKDDESYPKQIVCEAIDIAIFETKIKHQKFARINVKFKIREIFEDIENEILVQYFEPGRKVKINMLAKEIEKLKKKWFNL